MNKIHVTYKNILLPITFIAATLISACDNDKDAMVEAEKNQEKYMQEIQQKEHQQSMFFYDKAEMQKAIANINAKGGANLAIIEVRFFKGGYSFIRQSVNTPAKVEMFKFNNGYWGGTFACQLNHLWHYNRGAKTRSTKRSFIQIRLDQFQHYTRAY